MSAFWIGHVGGGCWLGAAVRVVRFGAGICAAAGCFLRVLFLLQV